MTKIGQELFNIGKALADAQQLLGTELDHYRYSAVESTGALILKFKIYDHYRGYLITSGTNPHLTEREQVIAALELTKKQPDEATLHLFPLSTDKGIFFVRPWSYQLVKENREVDRAVYSDSATRQQACWDDWLLAKANHRWPTRDNDGTYYIPCKTTFIR